MRRGRSEEMSQIRISPDSFKKELSKLLDEYGDEVYKVSESAATVAARATVQELKATSHVRTGRYARGWTSKTENRGTVKSSRIVYNRDVPQVAHLLNNSHKTGRYKRGNYKGDGHIDTAEVNGNRIFLREVESKL